MLTNSTTNSMSCSMKGLFIALLHHQKSKQIIIIVGLLLVLPSLITGLFADDFGHYVLLHEPGLIPQSKPATLFHLFAFIDNNPIRRELQFSQSLIPWWTSENLTINFWRPVSELTHWFDYKLLQGIPWIMHIHNLAWYGLLLIILARFYRQLLDDQQLALLALLLFAVDSTHGMTVAWIANRNALLAAVFVIAAFLVYQKYRATMYWRSLFLSCVLLLVGLLSAEIALTAGAFFLSYALFLDKQGAIKGLLALAPIGIICIIWALTYRYLGYGITGNTTFYIDPLGQPLAFLQALPLRFLLATSAQMNILPFHLIEALCVPATIMGLLILWILIFVAYKKKDSVYNFFLLSMCLSILPVVVTVVQDRNMLFVSIAGAGVLAKIIGWLLPLCSLQHHGKLWASLLSVIIFFHVIVSGLIMLPMSLAPGLIAKGNIHTAMSLPEDIASKQVVTFGMPLFDASYLAAIRKTNKLPLPDKFWNITTLHEGVSVKRIAGNRLLVSHPLALMAKEDFYLRNIAVEPIQLDQLLQFSGLSIRIVKVSDTGVPQQIVLQFDQSLDKSTAKSSDQGNIELMYWQDGVLQSFDLALNESLQLPFSTYKNLFERIRKEK